MKTKIARSTELKLSTSRLLEAIFSVYGGASEVARTVGVQHQIVYHWRTWGFVPAKDIGRVSRKLKLKAKYLNYEHIADLGFTQNTWKQTVVEFCLVKKLDAKAIKYILRGKHPKSVKELTA